MTEMEKSFGRNEELREKAWKAWWRGDAEAMRKAFREAGKNLDMLMKDLITEAL